MNLTSEESGRSFFPNSDRRLNTLKMKDYFIQREYKKSTYNKSSMDFILNFEISGAVQLVHLHPLNSSCAMGAMHPSC